MAQERSDLKKKDEAIVGSSETVEAPSSSMEAASPETEQIRGQIEETRKEMGETIDAIQERLSLENISEQVSEQVGMAVDAVKDAAYTATIGRATEFMKNMGNEIENLNIVRTVKRNPLPFLFLGLGAGLFAYQNLSGRKSTRNRESSGRNAEATGGQGESTEGGSDARGVRGKLSSAGETVSSAVGSAYESVTDAAGGVIEQLSGKAGDIRSVAVEKYDYYIEENPLAVGAVALALGAAIGFAIPGTRYESDLMGETRQNLLDKAQNAASDLLDAGKQVALDAGRTVAEQAQAAVTGSGS